MSTDLKHAALETIAARVIYLLSRLALPPLVLAHIGLPEYGLWSIAFLLVGYLGLSVSGLATVYVREIALAHARDDALHASRMLSTGVLLALLIGGAFCAGLSVLLPTVLQHFDLPTALQPLARQLMLTTCLVFLADLTLGAWGYVLNGLKLIQLQQRIWVSAFMLEWLTVALLLQAGLGMQALLWAFALRYALSISLAWWYAHRAWPALQLSVRHVSRDCLPHFLRLGLVSQLSDSWAMLLHSADRLIAGVAFGSAATALLDLGNKLPSTVVSISSGINQVILPHAATAKAEDAASLYRHGLRLNLLVLLPLLPLLVALAPGLLGTWLGPRAELPILISMMLFATPAWHLHILTGAASSTLRGQGYITLEFVYHLLRTSGVILVWSLSHDLFTFMAGMAIALGASAVVYLVLASQHIGVSPRLICRDILAPLVLYYLPAYLIAMGWPWLLSNRQHALYDLIHVAALLALPWALLLWNTVLHDDERQQLRRMGARILRKEMRHV